MRFIINAVVYLFLLLYTTVFYKFKQFTHYILNGQVNYSIWSLINDVVMNILSNAFFRKHKYAYLLATYLWVEMIGQRVHVFCFSGYCQTFSEIFKKISGFDQCTLSPTTVVFFNPRNYDGCILYFQFMFIFRTFHLHLIRIVLTNMNRLAIVITLGLLVHEQVYLPIYIFFHFSLQCFVLFRIQNVPFYVHCSTT